MPKIPVDSIGQDRATQNPQDAIDSAFGTYKDSWVENNPGRWGDAPRKDQKPFTISGGTPSSDKG